MMGAGRFGVGRLVDYDSPMYGGLKRGRQGEEIGCPSRTRWTFAGRSGLLG